MIVNGHAGRIGEGDINLLEQGNPGRKKRQTDNAILLPFQFNSTAEQIAVCGDDRGCLYDFALTGDREVAIATKRDFEILATAVASLGIILGHCIYCYTLCIPDDNSHVQILLAVITVYWAKSTTLYF